LAETKSSPSPVWLYRFLTWVRKGPFSGGLFAVALFLLGGGAFHWAAWQSGGLPKYQFDTELLFPALWLPSNILFWIWLDKQAQSAIYNFVKGLGGSQQQARKTHTDFISIGEVSGAVLLVAAIALGLPDAAARAGAYGIKQPLSLVLVSILPLLGGVFEAMSFFRLVRQLFLVNKLYGSVSKVNLFNLWPIYALSRYGYTIALVFVVVTILIDVVFTALGAGGIGLSYIMYTLVLSLIIFLAPLFGINRRLRNEKQRVLARLGSELDSVYQESETAVRSRKFSQLANLRVAAAATREQMDSVTKIATWPWDPGSVRNLLLPVLLPLFIAVLQRYLLSALGF
jgi:hypothetical protein